MRVPHPVAFVLLLLCLTATGCGRGEDRDRATEVATKFLQAVGAGDAAVACGLLADDTRKALEDEELKSCGQAIGSVQIEPGAPTAVELYLTNAKADLDNGDSAFLSLTADGWRISAAGCKTGDGPPADAPMDCELEA
jgi:hypothetical protein